MIDGDNLKLTGSITMEGTDFKISSLSRGSATLSYMLTNAAAAEGLTFAQVKESEAVEDDEWLIFVEAINGGGVTDAAVKGSSRYQG